MRDCFMLGAHHGLDIEDVDYVCDVLKKFDPAAEAAKSILDPGACDL